MKQNIIVITIVVIICTGLCFMSIGPKELPTPAPEAIEEVTPGNTLPNGKNPYALSIYYGGKLYDGMGFAISIPKDAVFVGTVTSVTETPDRELEASYGEVGSNVYLWVKDGIVWLGVEYMEHHQMDYWNESHAFALEIGRDEEEIERIERRKKWFTVN